MKKEFKKQIEREITEAINKILLGHNERAIEKAKKTIKEASKSVAKKFVKSLKAAPEKKKEKITNKKVSPKATSRIANTKRGSNGKFVSIKPSTNGVHKGGKNKIALSSGVKRKVARSIEPAQHN